MWVYVCVYAHTHTAQMWYSDVSPGVGMRHLEGPKDPDGLNFSIHIFLYVYKVHMCMYMLGGGTRSWTDFFFLEHIFSSEKKANANHRLSQISDIRFERIDPQLRALNHYS